MSLGRWSSTRARRICEYALEAARGISAESWFVIGISRNRPRGGCRMLSVRKKESRESTFSMALEQTSILGTSLSHCGSRAACPPSILLSHRARCISPSRHWRTMSQRAMCPTTVTCRSRRSRILQNSQLCWDERMLPECCPGESGLG